MEGHFVREGKFQGRRGSHDYDDDTDHDNDDDNNNNNNDIN